MIYNLNIKCTSDINFIKSIHNWISNNSLSLNPTETICIHLPSPKRPLTVPPFIMVNNHNILYSDNVKYINILVFISTVLYIFIAKSQIFFAL